MNAVGMGRTNYFKVVDEAAFRKWAEDFDVRVIDKDGFFGVVNNDDAGDWPEEDSEGNARYITEEIEEHLADGAVAIFMNIGYEGNRYMWGSAMAVHSDGRTLCVDLSDIYKQVANTWHVNPGNCEY